ncbi:I78 family peptidase inhibitor [Lysobacter yananisis]|uniref:I78 family peptidase inhibitor n=1 Tax=Lysobacter yananisis TaxID=1003114 RepID=A0ABY9PDH0_9GAMM|nr:I78 family peptidase inhibitor [Lysobacter yananisis]WMT04404.1 I78 family peptidase inhibitor [Lysobacter yananisis]
MPAPTVAARRILPALCLAAALPLAMSACAGPRPAAEMPSSAEQSAAGQTPVEPATPAQPTPPPPRPSCNAEAAKAGAIGKTADAATVERARAAAGGRTVRVLKPGQAITKEYLDGRVNVRVDANNVVVDVGCG